MVKFFNKMIIFTYILLIVTINFIPDEIYPFDSLQFRGKVHLHLSQKLSKYKYYRLNTAEINMLRWSKDAHINGREVFYSDKLFDNNKKDTLGINNCSRMLNGKAPVDNNGIEISLHHLQQRNDGIIVEVDTTFHRKYSSSLHNYRSTSEIDRQSFDIWRKGYWKERARMRCR